MLAMESSTYASPDGDIAGPILDLRDGVGRSTAEIEVEKDEEGEISGLEATSSADGDSDDETVIGIDCTSAVAWVSEGTRQDRHDTYEGDETPLQAPLVLVGSPGRLGQHKRRYCEAKRASLSSAFRAHTDVTEWMAVRGHRASTSGQPRSRKEDLRAFLTGKNDAERGDLIE